MTILNGTFLFLLLSMRYKMQLYHLSLLLKSVGESIHMKQKVHTTKCYNKFHVYIVCLSYSTCNVVMDHHRKSVILTSTFQLFHTSSEWMNPFRSEQTTDIKDFIQVQNSSSQRGSESLPWVDKACAAANPTMREFLLSHVVNGGTIPKGTQLRDPF